MQRSLILFAACAAIAAAPAAHAKARITSASVRVPVADLDLATPTGAETMLKRLRRASTDACGGRPLMSPLAISAIPRFERCRTRALAQAVADLDSPLVTYRFASAKAVRLARS